MVPLHVRLPGSITAALIALTLSGPVSAFDKYLPEKTEVVVGLNVRQVIESPPIKKHGPALMAEFWFKFLVLTNPEGFRKLIEDNPGVFQQDKAKAGEFLAVLGEYGRGLFVAGPLDGRDEDMLIVLRGTFEPEKVKEVVRSMSDARFLGLSLRTEKVGEREVYEVLPPQVGAKGLFVAVPDNQHILLSLSKEWMLASLASATGNGRPRFSNRLQTLLEKVDRSQSAWMVAAPVKDFQLEEVAAGIRIASDIRIEVNILATSADEARAIAQETTTGLGQLGGLLTELARANPELAPLPPLPQEAKIAQEGKAVRSEGYISAPVVENVLKAATKGR